VNKLAGGLAAVATAVVAGTLVAGAVPAWAATPEPSPSVTEQNTAGATGLPAEALKQIDALHGETTLRGRDGDIVTLVTQNGQVTAVTDTSLSVRSDDGTTWRWVINDDTRVGLHEAADAIKAGDIVAVDGTRNGNIRTALVVGDPRASLEALSQTMEDHGTTTPGAGDQTPSPTATY
jgi:hypothetical protein